MKYCLKIFLFASINFNLTAQTIASNCDLTDTIAPIYKDDADRLAIRHTFRYNGSYKDSTSIDQVLSNRYLKAFIAVHNATSIPARDTVITWLNIHTKSTQPNLRDFGIKADSNLYWMKNIRNNVVPCGQSLVDATISKFGFQKTNFGMPPFSGFHTAYFNSSVNYNSYPLGFSIMNNVPGVTLAGSWYTGGDGIDVRDSLNPNFIEIVHSYRWGDCIAGCMYERYWIFRVYNDCSVEYRGTFGNQLPVWASIQQQSRILTGVKIYPNPAQDKVTIEGLNNDFTEISIFNIIGDKILTLKTLGSNSEIDFSDFQQGVYVLHIQNSSGQLRYKLAKE